MGRVPLQDDIVPALGELGETGVILVAHQRPGEDVEAAMAQRSVAGALNRRFDQPATGLAAAAPRAHHDERLRFRPRIGALLRHITRVADGRSDVAHTAEAIGQREKARVAMHQDQIEMSIDDPANAFLVFRRIFLANQQIAQAAHHLRPALFRACRL